jgi:hypothetical protein
VRPDDRPAQPAGCRPGAWRARRLGVPEIVSGGARARRARSRRPAAAKG